MDAQESVAAEPAEELTAIAQGWQINLEPTVIPYREIALFTHQAHNAIVRVRVAETSGWLAIHKGGRRTVGVVGANGRLEQLPVETVHFALADALEAPWEADIAPRLAQVDPEQRTTLRRTTLRQALLNKQLATATVEPCWQLARSAGAGWWTRAVDEQLPRMFGVTFLLQLANNGLSYLIVLLIGLATFNNFIEPSYIWLVCLLMLLQMPFQLANQWITTIYNVTLNILVKKRLFHGILQLTPQETQRFGTGQFLAWGFEGRPLTNVGSISSRLIRSLTALVVVGVVLSLIGSPLILAVLIAWAITAFAGGWWLYHLRFAFASYHAEMINGVMERMNGHQTRLMQEDDWYSADDAAMTQYFALERRFEQFEAFYLGWMPVMWLLGGIAALASSFIENPTGPAAIGFAIVMYTKVETASLTSTLGNIVEVWTGWKLIAPIEKGAERPVHDGERDVNILRPTTVQKGQHLVTVQNIAFRYPEGENLVIRKASVRVNVGDRLLLEGPSGGGKSTLAYLLSGHYSPQKGLLFLWGLDKYTLGSTRWRQWVVYVPQFHQNHIISATLGFNLLMGRRWPPQPEDLEDAKSVLRELGLGNLLDRMPRGLDQRVGERGWHLSHGERSRIYIARALLQQADLVVLDESFASLDPETMAISLRTVFRRAPTLLVIAHP